MDKFKPNFKLLEKVISVFICKIMPNTLWTISIKYSKYYSKDTQGKTIRCFNFVSNCK
jgi:hypothetical protein